MVKPRLPLSWLSKCHSLWVHMGLCLQVHRTYKFTLSSEMLGFWGKRARKTSISDIDLPFLAQQEKQPSIIQNDIFTLQTISSIPQVYFRNQAWSHHNLRNFKGWEKTDQTIAVLRGLVWTASTVLHSFLTSIILFKL